MRMNRLKILKRNTGWGDRLRLGLLGLVFLAIAVVSFFRPEGRIIFMVVILSFWAPWLVRNQMVLHVESVSKWLRIVVFVMIGISVVGKTLQRFVPEGQEMTFALMIFAVLGLYTGAYFWLLSDERIVRR